MLNPRMRRVMVGFMALAACTLSSGCGGRDGDQEVQVADSTMVRGADATASRVGKVVFHMTGLVLVVPPKQGGDSVKVLLPDTQTVGDHVAWLGFGINPQDSVVPRLCVDSATYIDAGICYVDLDKWKLDPFGGGGRPSPPANRLPRSVLNVTAAGGGQHKVHVPWLTTGLRAEVLFTSGRPGATCSLATWAYKEVNSQGQANPQRRDSLANVLDWEIDDPGVDSLVFRNRISRDSIKVPLPQAGEVHIVIAHIPVEDTIDLPPRRPRKPGGNARPDSALHFHPDYDLLRLPSAPTQKLPRSSPHRRIPHDPHVDPTRKACPVSITSPVIPLERSSAAIGTLACMVASADPH
jgi:hypothetical protein